MKIKNDKDRLREWFRKWQAIRDNAAAPATRAYAEQYLTMLARQGKEKDRP